MLSNAHTTQDTPADRILTQFVRACGTIAIFVSIQQGKPEIGILAVVLCALIGAAHTLYTMSRKPA